MWHPNIWRAHRSQCSRPRLSTAPALGELRHQHRSPSPARWSFSVWSQLPWPSARGRQGASDVVTARLHVRPGQRPAPNVVGPRGPGSPAALELAKDKSSQPSVPPRSVPPLSPAKVTLTRDVGSSSPSRLNTVGNAPTQRPWPMFGVADPFAGVTRAGIWLIFRGFLSDPPRSFLKT